jgi:hypothetical protein
LAEDTTTRKSIRDRARSIFTQATVVPLIAAVIGIAPGVANFVIGFSPSSSKSAVSSQSSTTTTISSSGGVTIQGAGGNSSLVDSSLIKCSIYEEGFIVPLARIDHVMAEALIRSHSPIDKLCGLVISSDP